MKPVWNGSLCGCSYYWARSATSWRTHSSPPAIAFMTAYMASIVAVGLALVCLGCGNPRGCVGSTTAKMESREHERLVPFQVLPAVVTPEEHPYGPRHEMVLRELRTDLDRIVGVQELVRWATAALESSPEGPLGISWQNRPKVVNDKEFGDGLCAMGGLKSAEGGRSFVSITWGSGRGFYGVIIGQRQALPASTKHWYRSGFPEFIYGIYTHRRVRS
jgi:hypothetical protein